MTSLPALGEVYVIDIKSLQVKEEIEVALANHFTAMRR